MEAATPAPPPPPPPPDQGAVPAGAPFPLTADVEPQAEYNRFLPLVKWLLAFPHYVVLFVLAIGFIFAKIAAFFVVLFTGKYPRGIFDYNQGVLRWSWNVGAYVLLLTDRYPPFSLQAEPTYPAQFEIAYPEDGIDNWRPLVQWLLAIPYLIVAGLLSYVALAVAFIGVFVILFTAKLPDGMFRLILIPLRWQARGSVYAYFMAKKYPPWEWE